MTTLGTGTLGSGTLGNPAPPGAPPLARYGELSVEIGTPAGLSVWATPGAYLRLDITNPLRSFDVRRGQARRHELCQPGVGEFEFDNANGWLDPSLATSPYNGLLTRDRQLRFSYQALSVRSSNMEGGIGEWVARAGTSATPSIARAFEGVGSMRVINTAGAVRSLVDLTRSFAVTPDVAVRASARVSAPVGGGNVRLDLDWLDAAGALLSTTPGAEVLAADAWGLIVLNGIPPAGAARARLVADVVTNAGVEHFVDYVNVWQTMFAGAVERWPIAWSSGGLDATSTIVARDRLGQLAFMESPRSLVEYELLRGVRYPTPAAMFPLGESQTTQDVEMGDTIGGERALPIGTPSKLGGQQLVPFSDIEGMKGGQPDFAGGGYAGVPASAVPSAPPWSYMVITRISRAGSESLCLSDANILASQTNLKLGIAVAVTGGPRTNYAVVRQSADNATILVNGTGALDDDKPHLIAATDSGSTLFIYTEAGLIASKAHTNLKAPTAGVEAALAAGVGGDASFALACIWRTRLVSGDFVNIWADVNRPWAGHTWGGRAIALLDLVSPGIARVVANSGGVTLPVDFRQRSILDLLREVARSRDNFMRADRANTVIFPLRVLAPAPATRTFESRIVSDVRIVDPDVDEVATVTVTNGAGTTYTHTDATVTPRRLSLDVVSKSAAELKVLAQRTVAVRKAAVPIVEAVDLDVAPDEVADAAALDLYQSVDVIYRRPWTGDAITSRSDIIAITHRASGAGFLNWRTSLLTQPARTVF